MENHNKYIGRILDNRYEILELIGTGGMAYVYKALCHRLNRPVAIKILKEELALDEEFQRRFYTESQAIAMLSHPNIVAVYDVNCSGTTEYIVMELIEGITLKQYINRKGLLTWKEALHFATQITKALTHAHTRGIIHRDIKPHNIMILKDGSVKVADFGIARLLAVQNTLTQDSLGSVHYISPEQAKGSLIDARSDIYSVGVVMYEMLTSRLPFVGDTAVSVAIQHISAIPLQPRDINPDIPMGLEEITMHAMEPDVNTRFTTADEMLADLEEFRKNPAIIFNYAMSNPADRVSADSREKFQDRTAGPDSGGTRSIMPVVTAGPKNNLTADEYRNAKRVSRSTGTMVGVLAVIIVVIALFVTFMLPIAREWFDTPDVDDDITVPRFIGRRYSDIINDSEYNSLFTFNPVYENSSEFAQGIIMSQDPNPDTIRRKPLEGNKISVRIIISNGDEPPVDMPNLIGLHWVEAKNRLLNLQLNLEIEYVMTQDDTKGDGEVIETIPRYGEQISRGYAIIVRYAIPEEAIMVMVPDGLVGLPVEIAETHLIDLDLDFDWVELYYEDIPEGNIVIVQNAGQSVPAGTRIQIIVSLGPEPTPEPPIEDPTEPDDPAVQPPPDDTTPPPPDGGDGETETPP